MIKVNDTDLQQPMVYNGGLYTQVNVGDEVVWRLTPIRNQTKDVTVISNTTGTGMTITYDSGYTGLEAVNLVVDVPQDTHNQDKTVTITEDVGQNTNYISAHTTVEADSGYTGLGEVDVNVAIPCINWQFFGTITSNGSYIIGGSDGDYPATKPIRQACIQVQVPQSSGATFSAVTVTENQQHYFPSSYNCDGFNDVLVNVNTTPYYNSGYTAGYASGMTDGYASGVTDQKALMASTAFTTNGTYTRADGWDEVTVNVPTGSTINNQNKSLTITANTSSETITFDSGYTGLGTVTLEVDVPQTTTPIVTLTQAQYDALDPKDPTTIYLIKD